MKQKNEPKQKKKPLPADYGDATPEQVAKAFLRYRPKLDKNKIQNRRNVYAKT